MLNFIVKYFFLAILLCSMQTYAKQGSESFFVKQMKVTIEGEKQENFDFLYSKYIGKSIVLDSIDDELIEYFTEQDYLFPQISIVESDLKSGFLNIQVKMTDIDNVMIYSDEEDNPLISEYIKQILLVRPARLKNVQKYLALMNRIPGYQVEYEFRPSEQNNAVDLVLLITKAKGDIYVGSDSYGDSDFGQMQNVVFGEIFSPFGGNDSWTMYGVTTNHPDRFYSVGTNYSRIINNYGTSANFSASHAENNSTFDDRVTTKNGVNNNFTSFLRHPLYLDESQALEGEVGIAYKTAKDYTADINITRPAVKKQRPIIRPYGRPDVETRYWSSNIALNYSSFDFTGADNFVNLNFVKGIGGSFNNYTTPTDVPDKHYNITSLNINRDQPLPNNFSIFSSIMGGWSDDALPDQEVFFLGGRGFGRGYEAGILSGNKLFAGFLELRYSKEIDEDPLFLVVQPYLFRDMGYVGKQSNSTNISHLDSYGAGVRFILTHDAQIDLEIAQPMRKNYIIDGSAYQADTIIGIMGSKSFRF